MGRLSDHLRILGACTYHRDRFQSRSFRAAWDEINYHDLSWYISRIVQLRGRQLLTIKERIELYREFALADAFTTLTLHDREKNLYDPLRRQIVPFWNRLVEHQDHPEWIDDALKTSHGWYSQHAQDTDRLQQRVRRLNPSNFRVEDARSSMLRTLNPATHDFKFYHGPHGYYGYGDYPKVYKQWMPFERVMEVQQALIKEIKKRDNATQQAA